MEAPKTHFILGANDEPEAVTADDYLAWLEPGNHYVIKRSDENKRNAFVEIRFEPDGEQYVYAAYIMNADPYQELSREGTAKDLKSANQLFTKLLFQLSGRANQVLSDPSPGHFRLQKGNWGRS